MKRRKSAPQFRAPLVLYKGMMAVNDTSKDRTRGYLVRLESVDSGTTLELVFDLYNATELVETLSEALEEDRPTG
jgi:hypothetical protein